MYVCVVGVGGGGQGGEGDKCSLTTYTHTHLPPHTYPPASAQRCKGCCCSGDSPDTLVIPHTRTARTAFQGTCNEHTALHTCTHKHTR